ncbi:subtilisin-like protein [Lepidopterella palustris CBS 459.81]|uniref:Subtilisin-like protein n=1 Tax=Lepidopterella palustris CBS 459.81 TaxID=1314670 RepID=A0A8E2E0N3_9PEZI|nr:subtilisin-like protein [Lepidopterella palustris CBS 459.81]
MDSGHQNSPSRPGDPQDLSSASADKASHPANLTLREPGQKYYVYPKDYNSKDYYNVIETEAYLKTLLGDEQVTQNKRAGEVRSWTVDLSEDDTANLLSAYHGIQEVSSDPRPHTQFERRTDSILYAAYAKEPGKDTQAIRDFLNSKVPEEERIFINELKNDAGDIVAWGSLKLTEDGLEDVESHEGLEVIEDVVQWSRALPQPDNIAHLTPFHELSDLVRKHTLGLKQAPGEWTVQKGTPKDPDAPAPEDLIVVSQPKEVKDRTQLKDFVYEKKAGEGTFIYIIDQGIAGEAKNKFGNREFPEGRIKYIQTARSKAKGQNEKEDNNEPNPSKGSPGSHGTMIAAKAAGEHYGIAKGATIISVKCMDTFVDQMEGFGDVKADILKAGLNARRGKTVVVFSGSHPNPNPATATVQDTKIRMQWFSDQGIPVVIAAGNEGTNRPEIDMIPMKLDGGILQLINVGAANWEGDKRPASHAGPKVTVYAPGTGVPTMKKDGSEMLETGTSVAAPAVGGLIAKLMARDIPPWGSFVDKQDLVFEIKKKLMSSFSYERKAGSKINIIWNGATLEDHKDAGARLPLGSGTDVKCNGLKEDTKTYITRDTLSDLIRNSYCPKWGGATGEIGMGGYLRDTLETVEIFVNGDISAEGLPPVDDCVKDMHKVLDDCDRDGGTNPMN